MPEPDALLPKALQSEVDAFLAGRSPPGSAPWPTTLRARLTLSPQDALLSGTRYNVSLMNALVFYLGIQVGTCSCGFGQG